MSPSVIESATPTPSAAPHRGNHAVRVVAIGDVACGPEDLKKLPCRDAQTAALTRRLKPDMVLSLGDQQYESGAYSDFMKVYDRSWGSLRSITRPIPGNHEYNTSGAAGYYRYFADQQPGPPGYYSFKAGKWRIYALNSNCSKVDCDQETAWLTRQLDRHPQGCSAIMVHHPLFTSGEHGPTPGSRPLWQAAYDGGNDLVLGGHDHTYERFGPLTPSGKVSPKRGMPSFVVGTGGKNLYPLKKRLPASAYFDNKHYGVLDLRLRAAGFSWRFVTIDGRTRDRGRAMCH